MKGYSIAGISTCLTLPKFKVAFDVAQGLPFTIPMDSFFITHSHMDHASGIPYLVAMKALNKHKPPKVFVPSSLKGDLELILKTWAKLDGHDHNAEVIAVSEGDEIPIKTGYKVKCFKTRHRVPSQGYGLFETNKKLKQEYRKLHKSQLIELKKKGQIIEDKIETPLFTFTGDTTIEGLAQCPWLSDSKVMALECSFIDMAKSVDEAKKWGHIHLEELIPLIDQWACEQIVLTHFSQRYRLKQIRQVLKEKLPKSCQERVFLLAQDGARPLLDLDD